MKYLSTRGGTTYAEFPLMDGEEQQVAMLRIGGKDVRHERTGVHATIMLAINEKQVAYSAFNIERDEERVRLANSAFKSLTTNHQALMPGNILKAHLDDFCFGLFDAVIAQVEVEEMAGDPAPVPQNMILAPFVTEHGGHLLFGQPGGGKTWIAGLWAVGINGGLDFPWGTQAHRVLYVNLERSGSSMRRRLACWNRTLGLPMNRSLGFLNARGKTLLDVQDPIRRAILEQGYDVGVIDSLSRAGVGKMNDDDVANRIMDTLNSLFPTWIAIAHESKGMAGTTFGSQMFRAACDVEIRLQSVKSDDGQSAGIRLETTKANDIPWAKQEWALDFDPVGLRGIRAPYFNEFKWPEPPKFV